MNKSNKIVASTKKEILSRVSELLSSQISHQVSQKDLDTILETYFSVLLKTLQVEKEVRVLDLGKMKIVASPARTAFNPKTKEKILVKAKNTPKFTFSKRIKELVNEKVKG
ncbi:nucleoid DNA-binding protein [Mycoplasmoides fastidiosum]|uniref:Nucleoid DNA-binding protein n=1 Tax=Mycoplasmoides fastidiosum TaxID=92758 RepID=A0ABU0LZD3_9BACT|nr:HU family DNA-binding protein [Mycoplasmoides fastidiosum]MDQ0514070.1 nucleoid DNA-binding protein [Mycoplasmoides fastidiosum]UUD37519.1 HU family DNA-binding protein [Mycoplasmoides fastidiosum]